MAVLSIGYAEKLTKKKIPPNDDMHNVKQIFGCGNYHKMNEFIRIGSVSGHLIFGPRLVLKYWLCPLYWS